MKYVVKSLLEQLRLLSFYYQLIHFYRKKVDGREQVRLFNSDFQQLTKLASNTTERFRMEKEDIYPMLADRTSETSFDRHYVYHPAWAARIVKDINPEVHIDISSILHFCTIVSAFVPVKFYDYRPANLRLSNLSSESVNLLALPFESNSIYSLSCMHTVEHIGLGRYGDPLDYDGDLRAIAELKRVVAFDGNLLFVVPIGKSKIMFNAHRIYSYDQIIAYFSDFTLMNFSLVPDDPQIGGLVSQASKELADAQKYGCGCFWFKKSSN